MSQRLVRCATVQMNVKCAVLSRVGECPSLCNDRCSGSDSAVPVEVPLLQFIDSRRHPCYGGPDSTCGEFIDGRRYPCCGIEAVWGNFAKTNDVHRLRFFASSRGELITQAMSSISVRDCRCTTGRCGHILA